MSAVGIENIPDTRKQQIKEMVGNIRNSVTLGLNSLKNSSRKINTTQTGYQIPYFVQGYTGNTALAPRSGSNSFLQSNPPETKSMWVGLSYNFKVMQAQGMLLNDLNSKESLISEMKLRSLAIEDFMKQLNYDFYGDGTGTRARVTSVAAGTFTGTTAAQTTPGWTKGAHRLQANTTYDIVDEASFAVVGTITPTRNGTGSATVPVTTTGVPNNANAYVVEQGKYNLVPMGLGGLISNSDRIMQGLDTTDYPEFNNSVIDLNGAAITAATIGTLATRVRIRTAKPGQLGAIGHIPPGLYNTLAITGYSARLYNAEKGMALTSYGTPTEYSDRDIAWVVDPDMDEDRVYCRNADDFAIFEAMPFGPVKEDGLDWRQNPGANNVGAWEYFKQVGWVYNVGFEGDRGSDASAYVIRSAVVDSQVNSY